MDPGPSLGAIVRAAGAPFLSSPRVTAQHKSVLRAVANCRTPALGGHRERCDHCGTERVRWNSCRNRHCPQCQALASHDWLEARKAELLPVGYFHVVFTLPHELNPLALYAPSVFYNLLLRSAGQALLDVGQTKLHAKLGLIAVLHTWTQALALHPHVHCIVPGGGFSDDHERWIATRRTFLLPHKPLARRFRSLLTEGVRRAWAEGRLNLPARLAPDTTRFELLLARASRCDWNVYSKPPFAGPEALVTYLAAYTHRIAISNARILAFDRHSVTFRYRDSADANTQKLMTLSVDEFLRRYLLHVVPKRFVRIRYYGFLANRTRATNIARARDLIGRSISLPSTSNEPEPPSDLCPHCRIGHFVLIEHIDPCPTKHLFDTS